MKQQIRQNIERTKPLHGEDLKGAAGTATQAALPEGSPVSHDDAARIIQEQRYDIGNGVDARSGLQAGAAHLRDRARENVPEKHQDRVKRLGHSVRDYFSDKLHADRRKQTILRLKKMVVEIQGHPDYQEAIDTLLGLAENYRGHVKSALGEGRSQFSGAHEGDHLKLAESHSKVYNYLPCVL